MRSGGDHDEKHLALTRQMPCLVCSDSTSVEAAHLRWADSRLAKPSTGIGIKPADCWVVPLCGEHHREQTKRGDEIAFWRKYGFDPFMVLIFALRLYACRYEYDLAYEVWKAFKQIDFRIIWDESNG